MSFRHFRRGFYLTGGFPAAVNAGLLPARMLAALQDSGISNLSQNITLFGSEVAPSVRYEAKDIVGTTWPAVVGDTLSEASTGTSPSAGRYAPLLDSSRAVRFEAGKFYQAAEGSTADLGTGDVVIEAIFEKRSNSSGYLFSKWSSVSGNGYGWLVSTNVVMVVNTDVAGAESPNIINAIPDGWHHLLYFWDRDKGQRAYINGVHSTNGVNLADHDGGTLSDPATKLTLGARSDGGAKGNSALALLSIYTAAAGWLDYDDKDTTDAFVAERFARLTGTYADEAIGSKLFAFSRATAAAADIDHAEDGVVRYHLVGPGWPRVSRRKSVAGTYVEGYQTEGTNTNLIAYSDNLALGWTLDGVTVSSNVAGVVTPFQDEGAEGIIASALSAVHRAHIGQAVTNAVTYTASVIAKAGAVNWIRVEGSGSLAAHYADFDLANAVAGESGTAVDYGIQDLGGGWCRCWVVLAAGSTGTGTVSVYAADGEGVTTFSGDGTSVSTYVRHAQLEALPYLSSPINTSGAAATRNIDQLSVTDTENLAVARGTIAFNYLGTFKRTTTLFQFDTSDTISLSTDTDGHINQFVRWGGVTYGSAQGVVNAQDGNVRAVRLTWRPDRVVTYLGGIIEATDADTNGESPSSIGRLLIGHGGQGSPYGIISNLEIYIQEVRP